MSTRAFTGPLGSQTLRLLAHEIAEYGPCDSGELVGTRTAWSVLEAALGVERAQVDVELAHTLLRPKGSPHSIKPQAMAERIAAELHAQAPGWWDAEDAVVRGSELLSPELAALKRRLAQSARRFALYIPSDMDGTQGTQGTAEAGMPPGLLLDLLHDRQWLVHPELVARPLSSFWLDVQDPDGAPDLLPHPGHTLASSALAGGMLEERLESGHSLAAYYLDGIAVLAARPPLSPAWLGYLLGTLPLATYIGAVDAGEVAAVISAGNLDPDSCGDAQRLFYPAVYVLETLRSASALKPGTDVTWPEWVGLNDVVASYLTLGLSYFAPFGDVWDEGPDATWPGCIMPRVIEPAPARSLESAVFAPPDPASVSVRGMLGWLTRVEHSICEPAAAGVKGGSAHRIPR